MMKTTTTKVFMHNNSELKVTVHEPEGRDYALATVYYFSVEYLGIKTEGNSRLVSAEFWQDNEAVLHYIKHYFNWLFA